MSPGRFFENRGVEHYWHHLSKGAKSCEKPERRRFPVSNSAAIKLPVGKARSLGLRESLVRVWFAGCHVPVDRRQREGESRCLKGAANSGLSELTPLSAQIRRLV